MTDKALETAAARLDFNLAEIDKVVREKAVLDARLSELRADVERVSNFITTWHEMVGKPPPAQLELNVNEAPKKAPRKRPKNPDRRDVAKEAVRLIVDAGMPLSRREIYERLAEQGLTIVGKDPEMVLSTMLWREKGIIQRLPGGGYWPAGEDLPES